MSHIDPAPELIKAAEILAEHFGGDATVYVNMRRQCDHCGLIDGGDDWVFPYNVRSAAGKFYQHLCNPCFDVLGCSYQEDKKRPGRRWRRPALWTIRIYGWLRRQRAAT